MSTKLLLPLVHIGGGSEEDKSVETEVKTDVMRAISRETRVVFQYNHDLDRSPLGLYNVEGKMSWYYAQYCKNILHTMRGMLYATNDIELYATHTLKRIDICGIKDQTRFVVELAQLETYLWQTVQSPDSFTVGVVLDTAYTVHTLVAQCAAVQVPGDLLCDVQIIDDAVLPFPNMHYVFKGHAMYPIHLETTTSSLRITSNNGEADFKFGAQVKGYENKRAIL